MKRSRFITMLKGCVFSSILLLTVSGTVFSDWSTNPSTNTVVSDTGYAMFHRIISDGADGYFVVWDTSENCGDTYRDLYAQHYDVNGNALWGANGIRVTDDSEDSQKKGGICTDGAGGLIVTWNNYAQSRMGAQRISASGTLMWPAGLDVAYGSDSNRCISDGAGGVIIADSDGCQRINASGTPLWGPVPSDPDGGLVYSNDTYCVPRMATDGANGAIISWINSTGTSVFVNRVSAAGNLMWGDADNGVLVNTPGSASCTRIVSDGSGGAIVIWEGSSNEIFAQKVNGSGVVQWTAGGVAIAPGVTTDGHYLAVDGSGGGYITWWNTSDNNMYAQRIASAGTLLASPIQLTTSGDVSSVVSKGFGGTSAVPAGGFVTTWENSDGEIRAQYVNGTGTIMWSTNGALVSNKADIECPRITAGANGNAVVAFLDSSDYLYVQSLTSTGQFGATVADDGDGDDDGGDGETDEGIYAGKSLAGKTDGTSNDCFISTIMD